tara:strand:- start:2702 stop:3352 length:651 start_codon:yes stop_codon:yes gene_type:complete
MILKDLKKRLFTSISLLVLLFLIFISDFFFLFLLIIFGSISIIEFFSINKKISKGNFKILTTNILFIIYIFIFCALFFLFSNLIHLKIILFTILLGCIASDIGGYIIGRIIKGPKLTKISPNKTISGAVGSLIFSAMMISILFFYYFEIINIKIIFIGIFTSIGCQLGDLFFSYLKRKANMKDTGNFLPGHGGVLDRLDGILFGLPIGFVSFILIY